MWRTAEMTISPEAQAITRELRRVRQARLYTSDPVPLEALQELLEVARWTGSSRNTQPWKFIVITDKDQLRKISQVRTPINWVADAPLAIAIVLDGANETSEAFDEGRIGAAADRSPTPRSRWRNCLVRRRIPAGSGQGDSGDTGRSCRSFGGRVGLPHHDKGSPAESGSGREDGLDRPRQLRPIRRYRRLTVAADTVRARLQLLSQSQ